MNSKEAKTFLVLTDRGKVSETMLKRHAGFE